MPQRVPSPDVLSRLAHAEEAIATLQRTGWERDELPFYPTSLKTMAYEDSTTLVSLWETILTPRTASLSLGLVMIGDQVSAVNTGGDWQVVLNDVDVAMSGTIAATFSYQFAAQVIDLTPYRGLSQLKVQLKARRTSGSSTGGKFGGGGSIAIAPRYARLL